MKPVPQGPPRQAPIQAPQRPYQGLLSSAGSALGSAFGPVGATIGGAAGDLLGRITGWGDYSVRGNSIMVGDTVPSFRVSGDGVRIAHREYIADVFGSVGFTMQGVFAINAGLQQTFPWLAGVAQYFDEYRFEGLVFEYRPESGSYAGQSNSAALGVVMMATNYNVSEPTFPTKQSLESYEFSTSIVPFEPTIHPVECRPNSNLTNNLLVRNIGVPANATQQFYDLGIFQIATQGQASAYTLGELWVSYDVVLTKPRIPLTLQAYSGHITEGAASTATAAAPFGTTGAVVGPYTDPRILQASTTAPKTTFVLPTPGRYFVSLSWNGSNIGANATLTPGSNLSQIGNIFGNDTAAYESSITTGTAIFNSVYTVTSAGIGAANSIVVTGLTSMTAATCDLIVVPVYMSPGGNGP